MMPKPRTDVALVVLHRTAAGSPFVNPSSGIRIAAGGPDATSSRWMATAGLRGDIHRLQAAMTQGGKRAAAGPLVMAGDHPASGCSRRLGLLRQAVHGRLADYDDVNDAERFARNSAMRDRPVVSTSKMGRFETGALRRATRARVPSPART